jgi:hypothetical protein
MIHRDRQSVDKDAGTVAAVRDGVNQRDRSKDHAEFTDLCSIEVATGPASG